MGSMAKHKRSRLGAPVQPHTMLPACSSSADALLALPGPMLDEVLARLDSSSLVAVNSVCKGLRAFDVSVGLRLAEKAARSQLVAACGKEQASRWRHANWVERLAIEESAVGFDEELCSQHGFRFLREPTDHHPSGRTVKLEGMGPKLLTSDLSTEQQRFIRWRLCVRGNTAVEFGVVPAHLLRTPAEEHHKVLHKCYKVDSFEERPLGLSSAITVGSQLPFKVPVMKGSVVEVLVGGGRLCMLVTNPLDGQELYWHNTKTVPKPYRGPRELRLEASFPDTHAWKLAVTCWAYGVFDVMHPPLPHRDHQQRPAAAAGAARQRAQHESDSEEVEEGAEGGLQAAARQAAPAAAALAAAAGPSCSGRASRSGSAAVAAAAAADAFTAAHGWGARRAPKRALRGGAAAASALSAPGSPESGLSSQTEGQ